MQGYKDAGKQGYKDTRMQGYKEKLSYKLESLNPRNLDTK